MQTASATLLTITASTILFFQGLNHLWGPHTRFNSRFFQSGCEAVDAFAQNWGYNNWLCPPVCLIVRVIRHMELCTLREPLFFPCGSRLFSAMSVLEKGCTGKFLWSTGFVCLSSTGHLPCNSLFGPRPLDFDVIALQVNFPRPTPPSSLAGFCFTPDGKCYLCF